MPTIAEKRVFTREDDVVRALVAASLGVVGVAVSGDLVGEFGIDHRCSARDVAAAGDALAVATDEDVLVGDFEPTEHGPATLVSVADGDVLAVAPDGTVSRLPADGETWEAVGAVPGARRADGRLIASDEGVYQVRADGVEYVGLEAVRDVSDRGVPLAVTADGLFTLGNGWMRDLDAEGGTFRCVAADADGERAVAATDEAVYERPDATAVEWTRHAEADVVDAAVAGRLLVAVTDAGEARVYGDGRWRGRSLGVPGVRAVAVPGR